MKHIFNKKSLFAVVSSLPFMAVTGCNNDEPSLPQDPPVTESQRTVLVYMVATNNLGTGLFDKSDLDEMQTAAANGDIKDGRLLVYHASDDGVVLKEVTREGIDTLQVYDNNTPSVSVARMRRVIDDVKSIAPAKDYGMVFWSHATGWLQDGIDESSHQDSPMLYSFGADGQRNPKKMNITSLASALKDAAMSYLYFDCCYMGSVEVMYELRDCADYIIASPTEDPANGMPYDMTVKHMFDTSKSIREVAVAMAETTFKHYNNVFTMGDCPCTMSVISTQYLNALAQATRKIYETTDYSYIEGYPYQKFQTNYTCYYFDYGDYIHSLSPDPTLLDDWKKALDNVVIYADATPWVWSSFPIEKYSGLSTYILQNPSKSGTQNYDSLSWFADVAGALIK